MTRPVISAECPSPSCQRIDSVKKTLLKPPKKAIAKTAPAENEVCRSSAGRPAVLLALDERHQ